VGYSSREMGHQGFLGSNVYFRAGSGSADSHPKAELREQRGLALYTLASRLQKQEAKFNPYMVTCNFTGYFILSATWSFSGSV
jgi:predicted Zn-dependent peptidase